MAVKASSRSSRNVVRLARPTLRETIARLAPGTALRDGLERILRGRTGALIVIGYDDSVETICDGGFELDVRYAPTRLRELSKMDGAVVLSTAEIEDFVTVRDVMTVVQRREMVRRISLEIDSDVVELGTDGRQLKLQLEELVGDNDTARELIVRDYHANPDPPTATQVSATLEALDGLSDNELLDFPTLARAFGYPSTLEAQDSAMSSRRYRAITGIPRWQFAHVDLLVRSFGSLQGLLAATSDDLQSVEGIGSMWARHIREGLAQLAESTIADRLA